MKIAILMTCFNRRKKTEKCIQSLTRGNPGIQLHFVIVDDGSNDGTSEMLHQMKKQHSIDIIHSNGGLYYSGGMRKAMKHLQISSESYDYVMLVNDDVEFFERTIEKLVVQSEVKANAVIVGVTCDTNGNYTYGAIKYDRGIKYHGVGMEYPDTLCDTFNANCVLIPHDAFLQTGVIDEHYIHALGDFDYGLMLKRNGYDIFPSAEYVGICSNNKKAGTWGDCSLSRKERLQKKENAKGLPRDSWFYYLRKNFNLETAILYSIIPYIKILIKK